MKLFSADKTLSTLNATRSRTSGYLGLSVLLLIVSGSTVWAGATGDSKPTLPPAVTDWPAPEAAIVDVLKAYHAALTSGDIAAVERYVRTDDQFVMLEGKHSNWGWSDYRDNHLAPELEDLGKIRFRLNVFRVKIDGSLGYATFEYEILPKEGPEMNFGRGLATVVLVRTDDGWKIQHMHT